MRIGFFGGSFDPPHAGHLAVAENAAQTFALDQLLLAPVAVQPLKRQGSFATYTERLGMTEALCQNSLNLQASDLDAPREDGHANYTVDTLLRLQRRFPGAALFCIAGLDSFLTLRQWREPEELLKIAEWIVVSRPGTSFSSLKGLQLSAEQGIRVHTLTNVNIPLSATDIRARLAAGDPCTGVVPEAVLAFIREHRLYGT